MKIDSPISLFDFPQIFLLDDLSVSDDCCLQYLGSSEQLLAMLHVLAVRFVSCPVCLLTVTAAVIDRTRIAAPVFGSICTASTPFRSMCPTVGTLGQRI